MRGVSCPEVQEGDAEGCLLSAVPTGSRFLPLPSGEERQRERKRGGE